MIIVQLREAVIAALQKALPGVHVAAHGGTFDEAELKNWAVRSPALIVSVSDIGDFNFFGRTLQGEAGVGIALVTAAGKKGQSPDAVALTLLPSVLRLIAGQRWNIEGTAGPPAQLRAQNLYSGALGASHAALWGISFRQAVEIGAGLLTAEELAEFLADEFLSVHLVQAAQDGAVLTDDTFNVRTGEPEPE
ncbi:MAG: hypothetical protein LBQ51_05475 [Desulfovibrio sp.]|jgi:hypothetical protein|nr:hypothetical protein [Desulfovibrio sp.]